MSIYKPGRPSKYDPFTGKGSPPPSAPGEYRIRDAAGSIAYVGETNDLRRRMGEHLRHGKLAQEETRGGTLEWKTADGRSSSRTRRQHEQAKIARHDPPAEPLRRRRGPHRGAEEEVSPAGRRALYCIEGTGKSPCPHRFVRTGAFFAFSGGVSCFRGV